ncbi:MAG TPA: 2Fe-2S iron-sulfur cluster-binding protein [Spirochaetota bacterium]|nr:2Fe-2S iron-sulfur cluster-binding protein [Spirochaetota bacterium]HPH03572.1 2Fe-2S iron-sulfur cluster-binding protein [Spirochaetota bacterium]HPN83565.1 2Fe-2S iron-sulfur cluster-binding protein [Spirochaetota bacterium]
MATLRIENREQHELTVDASVSLLNLLIREGVEILNRCGGHARCGFCRVTFLEGLDHTSPRTPHETRLAREAGFPPEVRLACQTRLAGNALIRIGHSATQGTRQAPPPESTETPLPSGEGLPGGKIPGPLSE